jgi:hypothetical protein
MISKVGRNHCDALLIAAKSKLRLSIATVPWSRRNDYFSACWTSKGHKQIVRWKQGWKNRYTGVENDIQDKSIHFKKKMKEMTYLNWHKSIERLLLKHSLIETLTRSILLWQSKLASKSRPYLTVLFFNLKIKLYFLFFASYDSSYY